MLKSEAHKKVLKYKEENSIKRKRIREESSYVSYHDLM